LTDIVGAAEKMDDATTAGAEVARVRAIYARRGQSVPPERYARSYPFAMCNQHELEREMAALLKGREGPSLAEMRILDVGCGRGTTLRLLLEHGADPARLCGIDLLEDRLATAHRLSPHIQYCCGNAGLLPFHDGAFDLVTLFTTFTSILSIEAKRAVAREVHRVLSPKGKILWYDFLFNNPRNPDVRGVKRREIEQLFPSYKITGRRLTLAPPLGRPIAKMSCSLYHVLAEFRPFCTHYLCVLEKSGAAA
jgi:ubiquinone/menaquinone biosynthesis C-methylase UbiE